MDAELKAAIDQAVDPLMTAFEEFKKANNERIKQIETKGAADPTTVAKVDKLEQEIARFEGLNQKLVAAEAELKARKENESKLKVEIDKLADQLARPSLRDGDAAVERKRRHESWCRAVMHAVAFGVPNLPDEQRKAIETVAAEMKALNIGNDTAGGYLAPKEYVREITKSIVEASPVRTLVRVRPTSQKSVQIPKRSATFSAVWVAEQGTRSETTGLAYGLDEINTHEVYALIDVSQQQIEDAAFDMEAEVRMESVEQFAVAEGAAVVSGSGVGRPEGFLTNADVASTNSGSSATIADANGQANGVITLWGALKSGYARNANWVMNRATLASVRKLQDSQKQYIWQPGLAQGVPNMILSSPYVELPDMPNEGAGAFPIAYGDFARAYTLVDRVQMAMLRDPYTQATAGNIRFIMRKRLGGAVVLAEAIRKLKCST